MIILITIIISHLVFRHIELKRRRKKEAEEERKLLPFKKRITKRLSFEKTKGSEAIPTRELEMIPKSEMLTYLDSLLEADNISKKSDTNLRVTPKKDTSIKISQLKKITNNLYSNIKGYKEKDIEKFLNNNFNFTLNIPLKKISTSLANNLNKIKGVDFTTCHTIALADS